MKTGSSITNYEGSDYKRKLAERILAMEKSAKIGI
jgi:hypothetical protein